MCCLLLFRFDTCLGGYILGHTLSAREERLQGAAGSRLRGVAGCLGESEAILGQADALAPGRIGCEHVQWGAPLFEECSL